MKKLISYIFFLNIVQVCFANYADSLTLVHIGDSSCTPATYSQSNGSHQLSSAGLDIWAKKDNFDFACIPLTGDWQITALLSDFDEVDSISKAGIMIRNDLSEGAKCLNMYYNTQYLGFDYRQSYRNSYRRNKASFLKEIPVWMRLIRKGDTVVCQRSKDGNLWHTIETIEVELDDTLYYGLAVSSHVECSLAHATFDSVKIERYDQELSREILNSIIKSQVVYSNFVKDSFNIFIGLPLSYNESDSLTYQVAYHLDGGNEGDHYLIRNMFLDSQTPECLTVGVGYTGESNRWRDFGEGFPDFYLFLRDELIPYINEEYKTKPDKNTLYGYSFGGLCATQVLLRYGAKMPFKNIIAGSPSLWWPDGVYLYDIEEELSDLTDTLAVNFYITMGSEERGAMTYHFTNMSEVLSNRNYKCFSIESILNEGHDHNSNKELTFRQGHLWILNQPFPPLLTNNFRSDSVTRPLLNSDQKTINIKHGSLSIYPLPVKNILHLKPTNHATIKTNYFIYNLKGKIIQKGKISGHTIDVSDLEKGMYILQVEYPDRILSAKFIK
jgi:predicted alpha/beta superfamily hydrolase/regulation of enolase protein 1 (concanavalin A-like superfamily)